MLKDLRDLIFGLNDYSRIKLCERYSEFESKIDQIQINKLEDFEIVEDIIFKIKEELRVKSTNLNRCISDPKVDIKKKQVEDILERLSEIKMTFLKTAFSIKEKIETPKQEERTEEIEEVAQEAEPTNIDLSSLETDKYKISIEGGKVPYILVNFKEEIDLVILKYLSAILFDLYKCEGTNIITEQNRAMVIPRKMDDNLFELPRLEVDINEIHKKLSSKESNSEEYDEIKDIKPVESIQTRKKEEDSLDALLFNQDKSERKPDFTPKKDDEEITFQKEEEFEVEKKELVEPEIIIEKESNDEARPENDKETSDIVKNDIATSERETSEEVKSDEITDIKIIEPEKEALPLPSFKNTIYQDDKITVYLDESPKLLGELIIQANSGNEIKNIDDNDLSYINIFAKIFASVLFETLQAQGTNIIWDYNKNRVRIIPRFESDKQDFQWIPQKNTDEFLDQIKKKYIEEMAKSKEAKPDTEISNTQTIEENQEDDKEKLDHILKAIKRLP